MFKVKNYIVPDYLRSLFPTLDALPVQFNFRNKNDVVIYPCRTALFEHSFVLSAIDLWKTLREQLRNITTMSPFKQHLLNYIS